MKQLFAALLMALTFNSQAMAQQRTVKLRVVQTSDVHGAFFPYDFITRKPKAGTLARVSSYVNDLRKPTRTTSSSWRTVTSCRASLPATFIIM